MKTHKTISAILAGSVVVALTGFVMLKLPRGGMEPAGGNLTLPVAKTPAPVVSRESLMPAEPREIVVASTNLGANALAPAKKIKTKHAAKPKAPIQDPVARMVLSLVGVDPEAEAYWMSAINDPTLPDEERKDLVEDLNEDGLSDPHHPAPEDMPLIASRLELIAEMAPYQTDPVVINALGEAGKDLANLLAGNDAQ